MTALAICILVYMALNAAAVVLTIAEVRELRGDVRALKRYSTAMDDYLVAKVLGVRADLGDDLAALRGVVEKMDKER